MSETRTLEVTQGDSPLTTEWVQWIPRESNWATDLVAGWALCSTCYKMVMCPSVSSAHKECMIALSGRESNMRELGGLLPPERQVAWLRLHKH